MAYAAIHWQLGDLATWVGGLATAVALFLTWRLLRITRQEQRAAQADERRKQARLVSGWCESVQPASSGTYSKVTVTLQNLSEEPIYDVRVAVGVSWLDDGLRPAEFDMLHLVPPKNTRTREITMPLGRAADGSQESAPPVEIIFYDATGVQLWLRNRFGSLAQIDSSDGDSPAKHFFTGLGHRDTRPTTPP
jgi:hypothetical protein